MNLMNTRRSNVDTLLGLRNRRCLRAVLYRANRYHVAKPGLVSRMQDVLVRLFCDNDVPCYAPSRKPNLCRGNAFRPGARRHPGVVIE